MSAIMDNLNKSKKIIIFSAVLVMVFSCTLVLMSALAADSPSPMMSVSTSSTKTDTINDRPHLTWKTVKELVVLITYMSLTHGKTPIQHGMGMRQ